MLIKWLNHKSGKWTIIWNSFAGAISAGQAAIVLIFISAKQGIKIAGMVTIAYAIANVFMSIGKYGVRNYQVTDINEGYSFKEYVQCRRITIFLSFFLMLLYIAYGFLCKGYSFQKILIIFEVSVLKNIDAFEDVFIGRYQQIGRLDIGAKILFIRQFIVTALICVLVIAKCNIHIVFIFSIFVSIVVDVYTIHRTMTIPVIDKRLERDKIVEILKKNLPLCVGTTLAIYVGNIPKYVIDAYSTEETQAIFGFIMMPVFVITLLNTFIYQPFIKDLGEEWKQDLRLFCKRIVKQCLIVLFMSVSIVVLFSFIGLPILSQIYSVDLTKYNDEFVILLIGGAVYALAYYLTVPITVLRQQKYIAIVYIGVTALTILFGEFFVIYGDMMGAAILYLVLNLIIAILFFAVLFVNLNKKDV